MSGHADTRYEIGVLIGPCSEREAEVLMEELDDVADQRLGAVTSLTKWQNGLSLPALLAENQRLREALEQIADTQDTRTRSQVAALAREALAGDAE